MPVLFSTNSQTFLTSLSLISSSLLFASVLGCVLCCGMFCAVLLFVAVCVVLCVLRVVLDFFSN